MYVYVCINLCVYMYERMYVYVCMEAYVNVCVGKINGFNINNAL